jgi:site-specific DNA-methyltransferase (adenine-specific)
LNSVEHALDAPASVPPLGTTVLGDCLDVLGNIAAAPGPRFELIYVDPPFNAGGRRGARTERGARVTGPTAYEDHWGGLDAFIRMLEPRLAAMRSVLVPWGSLWLHLDHRTVHDAKVALDRVFGREAFRGEIIWLPGNGARSRRGPAVTHQTILVYAAGRDLVWNAGDPELREPYADTSLRTHFRNVDAEGRRYRERRIAGKTYRYYADSGRRLGSVWSDCPAMSANTPLCAETTGYPTQKPLRLLDRVVRFGSTPEGAVLDPMCGSGTTLVAARRLGRPYLGVDASPVAHRIATDRLKAEEAAGGPR